MKGSCEVCKENAAKYRCPGCQRQTCSLQCVNKHKVDTPCDGQRDKTAFVAVSDFKNIHLLSDYRFLEDGGKMKTNSERDKLKRHADRPYFLKELGKNAASRKIDLRFMPYPMSKRRKNTTTYQYRSKCILWHLELQFPQADITLQDRRVPETDILEDVLSKHFGDDGKPVLKFGLKPYSEAGRDEWGVFMEVPNRPLTDKRYYRLDLQKSLTDNFAHRCIVEYPTLDVVLQSHWHNYNTDFTPEENQEGSKKLPDKDADEAKNISKKSRRFYRKKNKATHQS